MPYVEAGEGEPLLFVHGSLCDYRYWQPQLAGLSKHYRCIAVSLTHYWPAADTEPACRSAGASMQTKWRSSSSVSAWDRRTWSDIRAEVVWHFISRGVILSMYGR